MLVQILYVNAIVHIRHDLVTSKSCFDQYTSTLTVRKASHVYKNVLTNKKPNVITVGNVEYVMFLRDVIGRPESQINS